MVAEIFQLYIMFVDLVMGFGVAYYIFRVLDAGPKNARKYTHNLIRAVVIALIWFIVIHPVIIAK